MKLLLTEYHSPQILMNTMKLDSGVTIRGNNEKQDIEI